MDLKDFKGLKGSTIEKLEATNLVHKDEKEILQKLLGIDVLDATVIQECLETVRFISDGFNAIQNQVADDAELSAEAAKLNNEDYYKMGEILQFDAYDGEKEQELVIAFLARKS